MLCRPAITHSTRGPVIDTFLEMRAQIPLSPKRVNPRATDRTFSAFRGYWDRMLSLAHR